MKSLGVLGLLLIVLGISSLVCSFFVPFYRFLPAWYHWEGTYTIGGGKNNGPSIGMFWGTVVEGMLYISGGNADIYFSVEDAQGGTVVSKTLVSNRYYFGPFQLSQNTYYFLFDNNLSMISPKSVYWIVRAYWYNLAFLIIGVSSLALGLIVTLYVRMKRPKQEKDIEKLLEKLDSDLRPHSEKRREKGKVRTSLLF